MKYGEIIQLDKHRLMCGDATLAENVQKLMQGDLAKMVFTDPPFNVGYKGGHTNSREAIANDYMPEEEFSIFLHKAIKNMVDVSELGAMYYVVMSMTSFNTLCEAMSHNNMHWSTTLIWDKIHFVMSRGDYHQQYEPIWYGWKSGAPRLHPLKDRTQSNIWKINKPNKSKLHPTTKPVELIKQAILNSTNEGDIVLDLFGGSGSTLIACEETNRICYTMELESHYCEVIKNKFLFHC